jgi:hypothetical protein
MVLATPDESREQFLYEIDDHALTTFLVDGEDVIPSEVEGLAQGCG